VNVVASVALFLLWLPSASNAFVHLFSSKRMLKSDKSAYMILSRPALRETLISLRRSFDSRSSSSTSHPKEQVPYNNHNSSRRVHKKYQRKKIPQSEKELKYLKIERQAEYEKIANRSHVSLWNFESLFPEPITDVQSVEEDLYTNRGIEIPTARRKSTIIARELGKLGRPFLGASMLRVSKNLRLRSSTLPYDSSASVDTDTTVINKDNKETSSTDNRTKPIISINSTTEQNQLPSDSPPIRELQTTMAAATTGTQIELLSNVTLSTRVDLDLTRMVEDRVYGMRRTADGATYDSSLMGDGGVKFREGVRLSNPLKINADRLTCMAKQEIRHGRVEEAQELYEQALLVDPRDGRAYLGLSRCAERRRDFKRAAAILKAGIANSVTGHSRDRGANPFLTQALGVLMEKTGNLSEAEALFLATVRSRPWHAAGWIALAQIRTRKLGQSANAGRVCYKAAERELRNEGAKPSSYVYTAWASMEYKQAQDTRMARVLFKKALEIDPRCSAAWLQLGVMEADIGNWKEAEDCFEEILKFDQRNSRALTAYALMETKRPEGKSRKAIGLFERALSVNPRDAGVLQAYALYLAKLGDLKVAREMLQRGTTVNKNYAPVWQAWGVLETREGTADDARKIFQQGIWASAELSGCHSGGYRCARLWQAWGVLEAREGDHPAARRCFSRALDADSRNVPAITAWSIMEAELGNMRDARSIFERALPKFAVGSDDKSSLWRSYELLEQRFGNVDAALTVYKRSVQESILATDDVEIPVASTTTNRSKRSKADTVTKGSGGRKNEVEVIRWESSGGEVWLNDKAIEGKVPFSMKKRRPRAK
jgi:tetratricopeptide (TPR) repeat protein